MATEQQAKYKQAMRDQWKDAAPHWRDGHDAFAITSQHVTIALADAANLSPGHHVLDLAGGTGEPSLTVARRVAPGGTVVCTDLVPGMLEAAKQNAQKQDLTNMEFELVDMEQIPFEDNRFNRVTSRFGIMFPPDTARALSEIKRVLRPGGRVAFAVWASVAENPFFSVVNGPLAAHGLMQPPPPDAPTPFRFAQAGSLSAKLREAGFNNVEEERREVEWAFQGSPDDHLRFAKTTASSTRVAMQSATDDVIAEIKANMSKFSDGKALDYGAVIHIVTGVEMKIGFIGGTGEEGMGLAYRFALAGHECIIGSRSAEKALASVAELRERDAAYSISGGANDEASAADMVVVTTPYTAQAATLPPLASALAGKIVISTVVPMSFEGGKAALLSVPEGSAAEQEQALLPQSKIVAAFQNLSAKKLLKGGILEADVVVCADDADARKQVMALAEAIEGVRGVDGGALVNAKMVEGITVLLVSINRAYKTQAGIRIAGI